MNAIKSELGSTRTPFIDISRQCYLLLYRHSDKYMLLAYLERQGENVLK